MVEHERQFESDMPQALADDLAKLYGSSVDVPHAVDAAILARAHEQLDHESLRGAAGKVRSPESGVRSRGSGIRGHFRGRRWRWVLPGAGAGVGLAAAAAIVMLLWAEPNISGDIDRNGRVDILDAFALARQLEAGSADQADWDINGDGVVDTSDVNAIAMQAVALSTGGPSS